jgi:hypothetical protein
MKVLRAFLLVIMVMLLINATLFYNINKAVMSTFLSSNYISEIYDENNVSEAIDDFFVEEFSRQSVDFKLPFNNEISSLSFDIYHSLDKVWLREQIDILIKDGYGYVVSDKSRLPVLNIAPLKKAMENEMIESSLNNPDILNSIRPLKEVFKVFDNKYKADILNSETNDELINKLNQDAIIQYSGISQEDLVSTVDLYRTVVSKSDDYNDRLIIEGIISREFDFDNLSDNLDLNVLVHSITPGGINPILVARSFATYYKGTFVGTLLLFIVLIFILLFVIDFKFTGWLWWPFAGLMIGQIVTVAIGNTRIITAITREVYKKNAPLNEVLNIQNFGFDLVDGFFKYMARFGLFSFLISVIVLAGIAFGTNYIEKKSRNNFIVKSREFCTNNSARLLTARVIVGVLIVMMMPVIASYRSREFSREVNTLTKIQTQDKTFSFKEILKESLRIDVK